LTRKSNIYKREILVNNMFGIFSNKKKFEEVKEETKKGFESVKKDIFSVSEWIKHLDLEKNIQKKDILSIKEDLSRINEELKEIKENINMNEILNEKVKIKQPFKTNTPLLVKQTTDYGVQTAVQTAVQTPNLSIMSITERAIIGILLNSDMKLSYEDIATLLGKEKSTIRGQINSIKLKDESIIKEDIEKNGKKRVYITRETKEKLLKKAKVRVKSQKNEERRYIN